ncbi:hypothetical protein ALC56_15153 [Trachymyrmex septentrionalis]|uniref:Uncharacterized protein n=1 Tax=Trachymyrmex septentrionalis TaxID=34720 RepID=A0A195ERC7_9HYME|nr:hypothetical protein ALC56_15153 [Trachymyrmex septentrionalis]
MSLVPRVSHLAAGITLSCDAKEKKKNVRGIRSVYVLSNMYNSVVCDTRGTVSFDRVRRWGKSLVPRQWRGRPLMGPKLISRNCGYRVRERARVLHNIIAPANGGNKQTRLSPVHTVTLAGFRLRRRKVIMLMNKKKFCKKNVVFIVSLGTY